MDPKGQTIIVPVKSEKNTFKNETCSIIKSTKYVLTSTVHHKSVILEFQQISLTNFCLNQQRFKSSAVNFYAKSEIITCWLDRPCKMIGPK
jgi:hypothetical protein